LVFWFFCFSFSFSNLSISSTVYWQNQRSAVKK
jgi:hypothetical protein